MVLPGARSRPAPPGTSMNKRELAVQLYTVREDTAKDFPGTLSQIAEAGYAGVEFAGYGSHTAAELRRILDELGLVAVGCHVSLDQLESRLETVIEEVQTLGAHHLACPFLPPERRQTANDYRRVGETLSRVGGRCKAAGLRLSYHNHDFEFQQFDGRTGFDILVESADPSVLMLQLDLGWINHSGQDPVAFLRRFSGRVPTVHIKDMTADPDNLYVPVGDGLLPIRELIAAGRDAGTEWFIVEQDRVQGAAIDCVRRSAAYMQAEGVR